MIQNNQELQYFLQKIQNDNIIAVDTEFLRVNTYYPQPCLMQIATKNAIACVDLLADLDLNLLKNYLYKQDKLLIFHSGRQDIEIFYRLFNELPKQIFDTQILASFLGYSHQVSYGDLVQDILKIKLEKKYSRFDWSTRPLPKEVIHYALDDVKYLLQLYDKFKNYQHYSWVLQDSFELLNPNLYNIDIAKAYKKVKGIGGFGKKYHQKLISLAAYREKLAIAKNKPRIWIMGNQTLFDYAMQRKKIPDNIVNNLQDFGDYIQKPKPANKREKNHIKELQKHISNTALQYNLKPEIIASKKDILKFIRGQYSKLNQTWRKQIMSEIKSVGAGDVPECVNVVIEIPANSSPVKYELDKETGALFVDRFMSAPMFYPANYGFVPQTLADDGDPADVLVITPHPLVHNCVIKARPVGVLKMTDDGGVDAKILAVPFGKLSTEYDNIQDIEDVPELLKQQIEHFFTHYKELEKGKWVKIDGWDNAAKAKEILTDSQKAYK